MEGKLNKPIRRKGKRGRSSLVDEKRVIETGEKIELDQQVSEQDQERRENL